MTTYNAQEVQPPPGRRRQPLSPEQIRSYQLSRTSIGRRGYHEQDVDLLLRRLAADVEGWIAENTGLREEAYRLKDALAQEWRSRSSNAKEHQAEDNQQPHEAPTDWFGNQAVGATQPPVEAVNLLSRAQREADSLVARARQYARDVAEHAEQHYQEVLRQAQAAAQAEAEQAIHAYRATAGSSYTPEFEEFAQRLAWVRTFMASMEAAEAQIRTAREALAFEVNKLGTWHHPADELPGTSSEQRRPWPPQVATPGGST